MIVSVLWGCGSLGPSVLDGPPSELPSRPVATVQTTVALGDPRRTLSTRVPPSNRPDAAPAPEQIALLGPFQFHDDRPKARVYKVPLPVDADLLPTSTEGTHHFGSTAPADFVVRGPQRPLRFERMGREPDTWGFDHDWLYVGVKPGGAAPDAASLHVTFARGTRAENGLNHATSGLGGTAFTHRSVTIGGVSHRGLYLPAPSEARFPLTVPTNAVLVFDALLLAPALVSAETSDGAEVVAWVVENGAEHEVGRVAATRDGEAARFDLAAYAGRSVELVLRTEPGATSTFDYVLVAAPAVYTPSATPRRVVLVFVDTLRADRLGFNAYPKPTTPTLDRWAETAAVFANARSVAPWTLPSARAALTGQQPEDWYSTRGLPEDLSAAGFATEAIVSNAFLSQPFDVHRGWDRFTFEHLMPGSDIVASGERALARHADRDLFLMVHFMGTHLPYEDSAWYRYRWAGLKPDGLPNLGRHDLTRVSPTQPDFQEIRQYVSDRYDANVRMLDDTLGPLLEQIGRDATVVLFSDHGEEFWDHGGFEHGHTFYDELLHVPLAIRSPNLPPGRHDAPTSLLDLAPTVRELVSLPNPPGPGRSLVGLAWGEPDEAPAFAARPQAFGRPLYDSDGWGVVVDGKKWWDRGGTEKLFALGTDPLETLDLAPAEPDRDRFPAAMGRALQRPSHLVWRVQLKAQPWPFDLELMISHPRGVAAAFLGYDPRGRAAGVTVDVVDGRMRMRIPADQVAPETIYVQPVGDPWDPTGLAFTMSGRQVSFGKAYEGGALTPSSVRPAFFAVSDRLFAATIDLAWVPEPSGVEVSGFHPDMASQLQELGYVDGAP